MIGTREEHFKYLDNLRESGKINMFGAPKVLEAVFDMKRHEAIKTFNEWADNFEKEDK